MQKRVLMLTTAAFCLACSAMAASAQNSGAPMTQPRQVMPDREPQRQLIQSERRDFDEDDDDHGDRRFRDRMGRGEGRGRGGMGAGMIGRMGGGMMGMMGGGMASGPAGRIIFALMDSDGDGTVSLDEFKAAHERIFKAMDANKDGVLTLEEIMAFMRGARNSGTGGR